MTWLPDENAFLYALNEIQGLSLLQKHLLLQHFDVPSKIFTSSEKELLDSGVNQAVVRTILYEKSYEKFETFQKKMASQDIAALTYLDPAYPSYLKEISAAPLVLYYRGDLSLLNEKRCLAVVGSRHMTSYGEDVLRKWIPELVKNGFVIVSGLAYGVDSCAHQLALENRGKTIAFQAQGVDQAYPKGNRRLYEDVVCQGLLLSEFTTPPKINPRALFPQRNRLISGLCQGVLIVEAKEKSGSLITAHYAVEQNRNVYVVPGRIDQSESQGCLKLIKEGAKLVTSPDDILEDYFDVYRQTPLQNFTSKSEMFTLNEPTDPVEKNIYNFCQNSSKTVDEIVEHVEESLHLISPILVRMQLAGHLKEEGGKRFIAIK